MRLDRSKQAKPRVPLRSADQCRPIDSISCSRRDPWLSSAPVRAENRRATRPRKPAPRRLCRRHQLVNPHYDAIEGIRAVKSYADCPSAPDLAVIAAPPAAVPSIVAAAGAKGTAAAIIITSGLGHGPGSLAERARRRRAPPGYGSSDQIAWGSGSRRQTQCQLRRFDAASRRPRADFAVRRHCRRFGGMGGGARHRLFRRRLDRRQHRRRFRRPARLLRHGSSDAGDSCSTSN